MTIIHHVFDKKNTEYSPGPWYCTGVSVQLVRLIKIECNCSVVSKKRENNCIFSILHLPSSVLLYKLIIFCKIHLGTLRQTSFLFELILQSVDPNVCRLTLIGKTGNDACKYLCLTITNHELQPTALSSTWVHLSLRNM